MPEGRKLSTFDIDPRLIPQHGLGPLDIAHGIGGVIASRQIDYSIVSGTQTDGFTGLMIEAHYEGQDMSVYDETNFLGEILEGAIGMPVIDEL